MPSLRRRNQWAARVKRDGIDYWLGLYPSYDEALQEERWFASRNPSRRGKNTHVHRNQFSRKTG